MIKAEIVAHSKNQQGDELISVLATFPRIILAEVNTHRMLSKNTSSSRAIPFKKMLETTQENPFIPIAWQKEHSGMQGTEYITNINSIAIRTTQWLVARDRAVDSANSLNSNYIFEEGSGVTKQLCNRLLEPFMWTTMLITGSREGWDNFFKLRCPQYSFDNTNYYKSKKDITQVIWGKRHPDNPLDDIDNLGWLKINKGQAEIHMMDLAEKIWDATNESTPKLLQPGEWHIPFEDKIKELTRLRSNVALVQISTAMGARTSYTVVGEEKEINPETLIGLHDRLLTQQPPHSSPMEHCSQCMTEEERMSFVKGKLEFGTELDDGGFDILQPNESELGWCYNHKGFIPYRYFVDNNLTL